MTYGSLSSREHGGDDLTTGWSDMITVLASDLAKNAVSSQQPNLTAHPGRASALFHRRVRRLGKQKGLQIFVTKAWMRNSP